mgnify:CR=1 FL=1
MSVSEKNCELSVPESDLCQSVCFYYRVDETGNLSYLSPSVEGILGFPASKLLGKLYSDVFDFEHSLGSLLSKPEHVYQKTFTSNSRCAVVQHENGELVVLDLHERPLHPGEDNSGGLEGVAYNITPYVTAAVKLSEGEQKYRRLVEGLGGDYAIYTHLPNGELTYVSPSVKEILGYEPREIIGLNWRELIGEDFVGRETADQVLADVQAGVRFYKFSVEVAHASGAKRLIEIQQRPIFSPDGEYVLMEGIAKDITETTRNAEEIRRLKDELEERVFQRTRELRLINDQLAESESRYRSVVEDQTEFICRWNEGGIYTFVNQAYCRYMNQSEKQLLGASFLPNIIDEDRSRVLDEIAGLTPQVPTVTSEHRVRDSEGNLRWHHWTNRALFDEDGTLTGYQSVGRDITDLKLVEDLVQEREEHLKRVSRLATMGELISGIAHEIHQPLHAAQLFAEAARRNLEMEGAANIATAIDCTREITNSISRTATIIRQLHSFTTNKPSKFEYLDINEVIREAVAILSYETKKAGVKLHLALQQRSHAIYADRVQMLQVFVDWFRNAFEAMSDNEPDDKHLVISTRYDRKELIVELCDNGAGTELENTERLFDAFYTTKPGRLGMGLSICKTIAETHHSKVHARNNPGRGMTFALQIPVAERTKQ